MTYVWLILFIAAVIVELSTCALVSIWFACGSIAAMIASLFGMPMLLQVFVFLFVSAFCILAFVFFLKKDIDNKKEKTNLDTLINSSALVEEDIEERGKGRVKVSSMSWQAKEENGKRVEKGEWVEIIEIRGVTLIVKKKEK